MNLNITRHDWTTRAEAVEKLCKIVPGSGVIFYGTTRTNLAEVFSINGLTGKLKTTALDGGILVTSTKPVSQDLAAVIRVSQCGQVFQSGNLSNQRKYTNIISQRLLVSSLITPNPDGSYSVTDEGRRFIAAGGDWREMPRHECAEVKPTVRYFSISTD